MMIKGQCCTAEAQHTNGLIVHFISSSLRWQLSQVWGKGVSHLFRAGEQGGAETRNRITEGFGFNAG